MINDSLTCSFQLSPFPLEWDQIRLLNKTAPPLVRRFPRFFLRGHKSNILGFILFIRTTRHRHAVTCELQSNNYKHFGIQIILRGLQRLVFNKLVSCIDTYIVMFIIGTSDAHDRRLCQSPIFSQVVESINDQTAVDQDQATVIMFHGEMAMSSPEMT